MFLIPHGRKGNCKNKTLGMECEVGLRLKTYNVLCGSVLSVWTTVESILSQDGNRKGSAGKMQVLMSGCQEVFVWLSG